jgi:hypothetical protein
MLDEDVRSREDDALPAVVPADAIGRPVGAEHLEDLGVTLGLSLVVRVDDQPIAGRDSGAL